jgi:hypothetical protein
MKGELADECDYEREARFLRRFRRALAGDTRFVVPWVWAGSTRGVLVMQHVAGRSLGDPQVLALPQAERDEVRCSSPEAGKAEAEGETDRDARGGALPPRALRPQRDADGPELQQLPVGRALAHGARPSMLCAGLGLTG